MGRADVRERENESARTNTHIPSGGIGVEAGITGVANDRDRSGGEREGREGEREGREGGREGGMKRGREGDGCEMVVRW